MKKLTFLIAIVLLSFQQCTSRMYIDPATLTQITKNKTFTFEAERIVPMTNEAVNIARSTTGSSAQLLNVAGDGYDVVIEKEKLSLYLPYFGVSQSYSRNDNSGLDSSSKDFTIVEGTTKKGNTVFTITPNDISSVDVLYLEVFDNGKAYLSINFRNKQPISYDGFIKKNDIKE